MADVTPEIGADFTGMGMSRKELEPLVDRIDPSLGSGATLGLLSDVARTDQDIGLGP